MSAYSVHSIEADFDTLMRQASMTAHDYMLSARNSIDKLFGEGYAAEHPELVAAFMTTAASDFQTAALGKLIPPALAAIANAIEAQALRP